MVIERVAVSTPVANHTHEWHYLTSLRERLGDSAEARASRALEDLRALDLQRHAHEPLLDRIWELRHNLSAYDAVYLALAEVLDTVIVTCDGRLARAPGVARRVELVQPSA